MSVAWKTTPLGDLCDIQLGGTPARKTSRFWDKERKTNNVWLSIADMPKSGFSEVTDSKEYLSDTGADKVRLVKKGTLLFSFKLSIGRVCFAGKNLRTNEAIAALTVLDDSVVDKRYLAWYLYGQDWDVIAGNDEKLKGKTLSKAKLKLVPIAIPSLPEQKRIVAILDKAFSGIETAIANAEKNLASGKELFDRYLNEIFVRRAVDWSRCKFGDICEFVRGPFGGSLKKACFVEDGYAVYEQQHAIYDQFSSVRYYVTQEKFHEMARFELYPGDLIMSCSGTMGKVAIAPKSIRRGIINQALLKLTPSDQVNAEFLKFWMESQAFLDEISRHSKGVAIKNVASVKVLKEIKVPTPPLVVQGEVVDQVTEIMEATRALAKNFELKLKLLDQLKQSLLQKAFSGELTEEGVEREIKTATA